MSRGEGQNLNKTTCSVQSLTKDSIPRPWDYDLSIYEESDVQPAKLPRCPSFMICKGKPILLLVSYVSWAGIYTPSRDFLNVWWYEEMSIILCGFHYFFLIWREKIFKENIQEKSVFCKVTHSLSSDIVNLWLIFLPSCLPSEPDTPSLHLTLGYIISASHWQR